jgi:hypothetical protein
MLSNAIYRVSGAVEQLMDDLMVQLVDAADTPENRVNAILQADKARRTMIRAVNAAGDTTKRLASGWSEADHAEAKARAKRYKRDWP